MARPKKVRYYKAKYSIPVTEDGAVVDSINAGEIISADHPYAKRFSDHLEPSETWGRFDVEQATAAPGEKRGQGKDDDGDDGDEKADDSGKDDKAGKKK